jgi:nucleoside-diphosphate-sugar epimerase
MRAKHILVTGATGFAGGHLCERLSKEGHSVRAFVRDPSRGAELARWDVDIAIGDLRDRESVEQAVEGIDLVYHLAAVFRSENVWRQEMWETNVQGTENLLEASVKAGVQRFIHCSTVGVHGDIKKPPANEDTPYGPGDHYQESKTEAERVVRQYMAEGRLPIVVFRPGGIYGPRDTRFLKLIKAIKRGRFIMLGRGKVLYQMIYIDDLINGILRCGMEEQAIGNVYILTGEEAVTLNQLVQVIGEAVGVSVSNLHFPVAPVYLAGFLCELLCKPFGLNPPLYRRRVDFFRKSRSFDISKARRELRFQPGMTLRAGMQHTVDWYRQEKWL